MAHTMLSFSDNSLSNNFLTKEDIAERCPMALRHTPTNPKVSERYVLADTETVIDDLARLGWLPVEAKQCRMKRNSSGIRSFHMLAFQNPNVYISKPDGNGGEIVDCYPRIILTNSHDGFSSFRFMVGLYRCVCSNGLIIATDQMADIFVRHVNYSFEELRVVIAKAMEQVPMQAEIMNDMQRTMLSEEQKIALATDAVRIRKGKAEGEKFHIDADAIQAILTPTRVEDEGDSLWNVYNVIQEHLMRGGYRSKATMTAKPRKARALTSVAKSIDFNKELFRSAHKFALAA